MKEATRQIINGVHVLRYPDNSLYVDVAERVRLVHLSNTSFSVEQGEIYHVKHVWFYRATITVGEQHSIGDAEIHFGAPIETPDGTNPVSCGQTSAIGNALTFAGFGDLRMLLDRLGEPPNDEMVERSPDSPYQVIQGIEVVMLDDVPYVTVAERIRHLHRIGTAFALESCTVQENNGVWIYRASVLVNGKRFLGDAEIFFDAPPQTIDGKYPISSAQTSAVGNALAFAGFGDVQSILERQGKRIEDHSLTPRLASADAVVRAKHSAQARQGKPPHTNQHNGSVPNTTTLSREAGADTSQKTPPNRMTSTQHERLRILYERLGEAEPATINEMTEAEAEQLIAQLQLQEEHLFQAMNTVLLEEDSETGDASDVVSYTDIGTLKTAWMRAYHVKGEASDVRQKWRQFKKRVCRKEVNDDTMSQKQYALLLSDIELHTQREGGQ